MPRLSWTTVAPLLAAVALAIAWPLHPDSAPVLGILSVLLVAVVSVRARGLWGRKSVLEA